MVSNPILFNWLPVISNPCVCLCGPRCAVPFQCECVWGPHLLEHAGERGSVPAGQVWPWHQDQAAHRWALAHPDQCVPAAEIQLNRQWVTLQTSLVFPVWYKLKCSLGLSDIVYLCLSVKTPCKGICSHLCLLRPGGYTCACPEGTSFVSGSKTDCDAGTIASSILDWWLCLVL